MTASAGTLAKRINFELKDKDVDLLMFAGSLAYEMEQFEEALKIYNGIVIMRPEHALARVALGTALYRLGRIEEAEEAYEKAVELDAKNQEASLYLGELIWNERKDRSAAEAHVGKAVAIDPKSIFGARAGSSSPRSAKRIGRPDPSTTSRSQTRKNL